ncbi:MAG: 3-deoxy-manno-octulosonate cytidylyltransferase [Candidatus Nitrohelix vancouverensis]|uniref:3-deoxy-manno-octulosonate cytidylyltransferase n=1 Tax=Candidatus Nitrohelix vancouverensis TaxID=2705534 RepID=A0A7T0C3S5_9BACT|nr:MAG: 3-deoxy-manno-octulosonate cytidylyltransferase [Candidatus Nitrohelix vancouverensis]
MPTDPKIVAVIPARWSASRFPGKPLAMIHGKPMVQWVYERCLEASAVSETLVATDDSRIYNAVQEFGGRAVMTSPDHPSGSDRIAEVVREMVCDIVVNVQGDEPLIPPENINRVAQCLADFPDIPMATLRTAIVQDREINDPNTVKVVISKESNALYFSRCAIPFHRESGINEDKNADLWYKHIGLYAYRKSFLLELTQLPESNLERLEKLEQLRVLENGYVIKVLTTDLTSQGVDTPEDLVAVQSIMKL